MALEIRSKFIHPKDDPRYKQLNTMCREIHGLALDYSSEREMEALTLLQSINNLKVDLNLLRLCHIERELKFFVERLPQGELKQLAVKILKRWNDLQHGEREFELEAVRKNGKIRKAKFNALVKTMPARAMFGSNIHAQERKRLIKATFDTQAILLVKPPPPKPPAPPFASVVRSVIPSFEQEKLQFAANWNNKPNPELEKKLSQSVRIRNSSDTVRLQWRETIREILCDTDMGPEGMTYHFDAFLLAAELEEMLYKHFGFVNNLYLKRMNDLRMLLMMPSERQVRFDFVTGKITALQLSVMSPANEHLMSEE